MCGVCGGVCEYPTAFGLVEWECRDGGECREGGAGDCVECVFGVSFSISEASRFPFTPSRPFEPPLSATEQAVETDGVAGRGSEAGAGLVETGPGEGAVVKGFADAIVIIGRRDRLSAYGSTRRTRKTKGG